MPSLARIGDACSGICTAHHSPQSWTGAFTTGSSSSTCEGLGIVRVGDLGSASCGHFFTVSTGSAILLVDGLAAARTGDTVVMVLPGVGTGTIDGGASTTTVA